MWLAGLIVCLGWLVSLCFHELSHSEDPDFETLQQDPNFIALLTQNNSSID